MEEGFYWRYPNHFIANHWIRWWIHLTVLPEYDDARPWRPVRYDGEHAQAYFKWGHPYIAGIYQVVTGLTPCVPYRLTMWARNHSLEDALPHARIGLDPRGTQLTLSDDDCAVKAGLPPLTVWSREQTALFVWEELAVEAEPLGDRLTAILYASPQPGPRNVTYYYDTFWDAGRLVQVPFPGNKLPAPSSWTPSAFIQNLRATPLLDTLLVTWDTPQTAPSQVWYRVESSGALSTLGGTGYDPVSTAQSYPGATPPGTAPVTNHRAVITGLKLGDKVEFVALSRRPMDTACVTEVSAPQTVVMPDRLQPSDWTPSGFIQNLRATPLLDKLLITWDTPEPAATQLMYDIIPPSVVPTGTLVYTHSVYLPLVLSGSGAKRNYQFMTPLDLTRSTHHEVIIENLGVGDTVRFVALAGWVVNDRLVTDVSAEQRFTMPDRVPPPTSWEPSGVVQNLVVTAEQDSLVIGWETPAFSSTTQVWYNVVPKPPAPPTGTLVYTYYVYLPLVTLSTHGARTYTFATPLDLRRTVTHQARITNLPDGATVTLVALSSNVVDKRVITEVSEQVMVKVDTSFSGRVYPPSGP
ncbi:MAG: hypothetical protein N2508_07565 [Anaerolineae bacterium]|nr:hypothetical protein [Anaerolineae bacterium]